MTTSPVVSVTDELIAELEEWFANEARDCKGGEPVLGITADHLRAVFAKRAELKRDAERYRYIRDNGIPDPAIAMQDSYYGELELVSPDRLDAAIDSVMQS